MPSSIVPRFGLCLCALLLSGCTRTVTTGTSAGPSTEQLAASLSPATLLTGADPLLGATSPVRDPSMMESGSTLYLFSTDTGGIAPAGYLPIRCSSDTVTWADCGYVFPSIPAWVQQQVPRAKGLWAPDISYFGGVYHLYYAASTLLSQDSAIGEATNVTLDPASPAYAWVDHGEVLASSRGNDFNAIDPNILVDTSGAVWLTYGSFWSGIKQHRIDPATGMLSSSDTTTYSLAARPASLNGAIEGASLVQHGGYYYLFASVGHCCASRLSDDNYEQVVGRGTSPQGPFVDQQGVDMRTGGGTILLEGGSAWAAPGGGSAYLDPGSGTSLLPFHALNVSTGGTASLWIKQIAWTTDWPVLE